MKNLNYLALLDVYGEMLTDRQREMLSDYYERDFSLSEIADNFGVTRQAVYFAIKQAEACLDEHESKLHFCEFITELNGKLSELAKKLGDGASELLGDLDDCIRSNYGTVR